MTVFRSSRRGCVDESGHLSRVPIWTIPLSRTNRCSPMRALSLSRRQIRWIRSQAVRLFKSRMAPASYERHARNEKAGPIVATWTCQAFACTGGCVTF
jgi:hypothetical protein